MQCIRGGALRLALALALCALPSTVWGLSLGEKANLQAAMQQHIDGQMVDGVYLYLDSKSGEVRALHPVTAHPMIFSLGEHYVLCSDFRDDEGEKVNIDFYLARDEANYVVFHTEIDDRKLLKQLMKDGKVTRAE